MNKSSSSSSEEKKESTTQQLAGFAPASRGTTTSSSGGAQSTAVAAAASTPSSSDGNSNNVDTANKNHNSITKKKSSSVAATKQPPPAAATKKRRSKNSSSASAAAGGSSSGIDSTSNSSNNYNEDTTIQPILETISSSSFQPISLSQIQLRIKVLLDKLPSSSVLPEIPPDYNIIDSHQSNKHNSQQHQYYYPPIKSFASSLQIIIEEYNLLLSLVSAATYQWGVDRSGASQQNLSVMNSELQQCQEVIASVVSGRLSNVLCPAVDVMIGRVEIVNKSDDDDHHVGDGGNVIAKKRKLETTSNNTSITTTTADRLLVSNTSSNHHNHTTPTKNEQRINHYTRPLVDPSYVHLCYQIVARNSAMLRYTIATCIHTAYRVIGDYLKAMRKDVGHEVNKGGYY